MKLMGLKASIKVVSKVIKQGFEFSKSFYFIKLFHAIINGLYPLVNIVLPKYLIDELINQKRIDYIIFYVALTVGINVFMAILNQILSYFINRENRKISNGFNFIMAEKTASLDFQYTEDPQILDLKEKGQQGYNYANGPTQIINNATTIISSAISLMGSITIVSMLNPLLFIVLVGFVGINFWVDKKRAEINVQFNRDLVPINRQFGYYINTLLDIRYGKDVRIYDGKDMIMDRLDGFMEQNFGKTNERIKKTIKLQWIVSIINGIQQALLYGYIGFRALPGPNQISLGTFQMMIRASFDCTIQIKAIFNQLIYFRQNGEFLSDYMKYIELENTLKWGERELKDIKNHTYEFKNVSFKYPRTDNYVLKNVSFKINEGQKISVVGENGAGKTTMIKLLLRLYDPNEGEVLLDGVSAKEYTKKAYYSAFSAIFQDFKLLSYTVRENIDPNENNNEKEIINSLEKAGIYEKLKGLEKGINTNIYKNFDEQGLEFSGGERQKIAIARAVFKNSPMVILDEPTSALDPIAEYEIYNKFDTLIGNKTAIYISHRLSSCRFSDKILVFKGNRVSQEGTHHELVKESGVYKEMWNAQAQYYK